MYTFNAGMDGTLMFIVNDIVLDMGLYLVFRRRLLQNHRLKNVSNID